MKTRMKRWMSAALSAAMIVSGAAGFGVAVSAEEPLQSMEVQEEVPAGEILLEEEPVITGQTGNDDHSQVENEAESPETVVEDTEKADVEVTDVEVTDAEASEADEAQQDEKQNATQDMSDDKSEKSVTVSSVKNESENTEEEMHVSMAGDVPIDNSTTIADGSYTIEAEQFSFSGGTGKVKITCGGVRIENGRSYALIQFSSKNYTRIKAGGVEYETELSAGKAQAEIPVKINGVTDISGCTEAMSEPHWVDYQITITLPEGSGSGGDKDDNKDDSEDDNKKPDDTKPDQTLKDGKYSIEVDSSASMFRVTNCAMTVKNGKITAVITLSGTGYSYLYPGTASDAGKADKKEWIPFAEDKEGKYTYTLSLSSIDAPVAVAAYSTKNKKWYDRTLTFKKETLVLQEGGDTGNPGGNTGNTGSSTENPGANTGSNIGNPGGNTGNNNSSWGANVGGSTSGINSSTNLADGTYAPDKFSFSGGTGRVSISCPAVTVRGGQAYATIVFSSGAYSYVKANGSTYYGTNGAGTSTFEIPVQLNQNNTIIGCTTRMSAAHEITYSIFVYIEGAVSGASSGGSAASGLSSTELSKEAPEIAGLTFTEETKTEEAEYYKIFKYEGGITCIEIDLGVAADKELKLYGREILRYLVVPHDAEIPAGLDKEMVVIRQPDKTSGENFRAYVASQNALGWMDGMDQLENLALLGIEKENCQVENVKKLLENKEVTFAGTYDNMEYKSLVKGKCDLAIMPAEILPLEKEEADSEEDFEKYIEAAGNLDELNIPVFVDRSSLEKTKKGQAEWIKVYGIIFGCEDEAEALCQSETEKE